LLASFHVLAPAGLKTAAVFLRRALPAKFRAICDIPLVEDLRGEVGRPDIPVTIERPSRILYVCYAPPVPTRLGPARRHYHMLDQLSRFYDVHLLSLGSPLEAQLVARHFADRVKRFDFARRRIRAGRTVVSKAWRTVTSRCDFVPTHEPDLRRLCGRVTSTAPCDAIFLSSVLLRGLPLPPGIPVIGDTHNAEFDVLRRTAALSDRFIRRQYARWQWPLTRREEQRCARQVDLLLATSERDREVFEDELGVTATAVIPNGIDVTEFDPSGAPPTPGTIVFSGLMSYYPNQQGMRWFLEAIFPLIRRTIPAARVIIAGAAPPQWLKACAGERVEVTGCVPDIRPYLQRACVVIAPLLIGGGTRVKILEALAMERPVVSTSLGAEGLRLRHDDSVLIADDAESFARRVIELLKHPDRAAHIAVNGREHAIRHFDWNQIGAAVSGLLQARIGLNPRKSEPHARPATILQTALA
jgi:glycosyltransferase involved in cell wall biosynthesis